MKVLVINSGSSSLKYQFIDMDGQKTIGKGLIERIGIDEDMPDHQQAIKKVFANLINEQIIDDISAIDAVGHRVVHGGEKFSSSILVNEKIIKELDNLSELAPLHNPPNIAGIEACHQIMPGVPQVAVFDTAFFHTMPEKEYLYALPYKYYENYSIRKYGFHGTSHKYVTNQAASILGRKDLRIISCHLGNGSSITAVKDGQALANSLGFTPLAGVIMGTRSGDIDPAILPFLMEKDNLSAAEINNILNKESGVLGISGISSDFRDIEKAATAGNHRAAIALDMFAHSVKKYIGSYLAILGGLDVLIFTAGIGENSPEMRALICEGMEGLGIKLDQQLNGDRGQLNKNTADAQVKIMVIPTNEELMIAQETIDVLNK